MPLALLLLGDLLDLLGVYSSFLPLTTSLSLAMAVPQCFSSRPRLDRGEGDQREGEQGAGQQENWHEENREQDSGSRRTELENREQESGRTEHK